MADHEVSLARFQEHVGTIFRVIDAAAPELELTVASVTDLSDREPARPAELPPPFSVMFHGPLTPILPQAIYRLRNDDSGSLDIFIVPIGPEGAAMRYEASFA